MQRRQRTLTTIALGVVLLAGACSSSKHAAGTDKANTSTSTTVAPVNTVSDVTLVPNPDSVLSFQLKFTTTAPAVATLHVDGPANSFGAKPEKAAATQHSVPVVGLRARSTYQAWVTVPSGTSTVESKKVAITTGALPADLPPVNVKSDPARMAPGVTMFTSTLLVPPKPGPGVSPMLGRLIAVDPTGHVVWYHRAPLPIGDARMLANGDILYEYNDMGAQEIDILGHVVHEWAGKLELGEFKKDNYGRPVAGPDAIPVDIDSMHHEVNMLPDGNMIVLSTELRDEKGFDTPQCGEPASSFSGSYQLISDVVVVFAPDTGKVLQKIALADLLDPQHKPGDGPVCGPPGIPDTAVPNFLYTSHGKVHDWTHANAVILDEKRNALIVSIRHLDTVMALRYKANDDGPAGAVLWRFGPAPGDFKLTAGGQWQYHEHAPELQADGSILLYDNGNDRPNTNPLYSRAVQYKVNDTGPRDQWTVTQTWEFKSAIDGTPAYAFFVGDADRQPNGNVLIDNGGITPAVKGVASQITEVVPAKSGEGGDVVFDLRVPGTPPSFVYRAERIPSLYG